MGLHGMQRIFLVKCGQYIDSPLCHALHLVVAIQLIGQKWPITPFLPQDVEEYVFWPIRKKISDIGDDSAEKCASRRQTGQLNRKIGLLTRFSHAIPSK